MRKIKFKVKKVNNHYLSFPDPFIPDGMLLVLYQNGLAEIGKYHEATEAEDVFLSHPKNSGDFSDKLKELIKINYPEDIDDEDSSCYLLPEEYYSKLIWD